MRTVADRARCDEVAHGEKARQRAPVVADPQRHAAPRGTRRSCRGIRRGSCPSAFRRTPACPPPRSAACTRGAMSVSVAMYTASMSSARDDRVGVVVPARDAVPARVVGGQRAVAAHDRAQLGVARLVEARAALLLGHVAAADHAPAYRLHAPTSSASLYAGCRCTGAAEPCSCAVRRLSISTRSRRPSRSRCSPSARSCRSPRDQRDADHEQERKRQHLDRRMRRHEAADGAGEHHHQADRHDHRGDHHRDLAHHAHRGDDRVEREHEVDDDDLREHRGERGLDLARNVALPDHRGKRYRRKKTRYRIAASSSHLSGVVDVLVAGLQPLARHAQVVREAEDAVEQADLVAGHVLGLASRARRSSSSSG